MKQPFKIAVLGLVFLAMLPLLAWGQQLVPADPPETPSAAATPPTYTQQQIDQLTAPIALYPDQLVGQILMASTYPLEIVEASRWQQDPQNAQLTGDQLAAALQQQPWDPSVKALVAFPQVLSMLNKNLQWTEQLGDAFLAQQPAVMDSVQRLRSMAQTSGNLSSTPEQTVSGMPGAIEIEPANPDVIYVPTYNPSVVYGAWPWAGYPPYYFPEPPGYVYATVGPIAFAFGIGVIGGFWDWDHWDWRNHHLDIDDSRFEELNRGRPPSFSGGVWAHDVTHRHGVPYQSTAARAQFQGASNQARRNFRGFDTQNEGQITNAVPQHIAGPAEPSQRVVSQHVGGPAEPTQRVVPQHVAGAAEPSQNVLTQHVAGPAERSQMQVPIRQQQSPPVFESFSRGADVRAQSERGATSRATQPAQQQRAAPRQSPAARQAPSGGGNQNNRDNGRNR